MSSPHSILVIGSLNLDMVLELPRMPRLGESLIGQRYAMIAGGKGANQAVALARLGIATTLAGKVGNDTNGIRLLDDLRREHVATEFVSISGDHPTGLAVVLLDSAGRNSILVFPGANNALDEGDVQRAFENHAFDAVMLQFEIPDQAVIASCRLARKAGVPVFVDAGPARPFPLEQIQGIDFLSPNETETLALTGIEPNSLADIEHASEVLMARSRAAAVIVKLGERGAFLRTTDGHCEHFPAPHVNAIDPTAAGDAFGAALMARYLDTHQLAASVQYANVAGALAATKLGAQPSLPTSLEIEQSQLWRSQQPRNTVVP